MNAIKASKHIIILNDDNTDKLHVAKLKRVIERLEEESKKDPIIILTNPRIVDYTPIIDARENSHIFIPKRKKRKGYQKK